MTGAAQNASSHRQLCLEAKTWLERPASRGGPGCRVAFSEVQTPDAREVSDAIGIVTGTPSYSILVEVKVSRADFFADVKKPHRNGDRPGVGTFRYYLTPPGLIQADELPPKWGLIEVGGRPRFRVQAGHLVTLQEPWPVGVPFAQHWGQIQAQWGHVPDHGQEVGLLAQLLARVGDPDKVNVMLKESLAARTQAARTAQRLNEENRKLRAQVRRLELARWDPELTGDAPAAMKRVVGHRRVAVMPGQNELDELD